MRDSRIAPLLALISLVLAAACGERAEVRTLDQAIRWSGDISLQETPRVINVSPQVALDGAGRFLVADMREAQVRVYAPDGRLERHFGRRGDGPGEYGVPITAVRLPSGEILTAELSGRFAVLDAAATRVVRTGRFPVTPLFDLDLLDDSLVVLGGFGKAGPRGPLLHVARIDSGAVVRSFFVAPVPAGLASEHLMTTSVSNEVRGGTITALYTHSDTLYAFRADGRPAGKVRIPFRGFRPLGSTFEGGGREDLLAWSESFSMASHLFAAAGGGWLVQYFDRVGGDVRWSLLRMSAGGERRFEIQGTPQLLATGARGRLFFVKPGSETPNVWSVGTLVR